jgi:molybdopterin-guanine dinucleotide biosynthesis protein A
MTVSAAILAGGRATRFDGRDKSALVVDGRTILGRQIDALTPLTDDILIVGAAAHPAARTIGDRVDGCGPLGGLDAALAHAKGDTLILLACDMPFVTTALLGHLADAAATDVHAVVPRTERGYHPLCAVYCRAAADVVAGNLAERRLKMTDLLAALRVHVVSSGELERFGNHHRLLANVNTAADFAALVALQGHEL